MNTALNSENSAWSTISAPPGRSPIPASRLAGAAWRSVVAAQDIQEKAKPSADENGPPVGERYHVMMDWEGVVEEVASDSFVARLVNRRARVQIDTEAADIPLTEVADDDLKLVVPGAIFYLTVYRVVSKAGQQSRTTRLFFRRMPGWTPAMLKSAKERANKWKKHFGVAEHSSSSS